MSKESKVTGLTLEFNRNEVDSLFYILTTALETNTLEEAEVDLIDKMLSVVNKIREDD